MNFQFLMKVWQGPKRKNKCLKLKKGYNFLNFDRKAKEI